MIPLLRFPFLPGLAIKRYQQRCSSPRTNETTLRRSLLALVSGYLALAGPGYPFALPLVLCVFAFPGIAWFDSHTQFLFPCPPPSHLINPIRSSVTFMHHFSADDFICFLKSKNYFNLSRPFLGGVGPAEAISTQGSRRLSKIPHFEQRKAPGTAEWGEKTYIFRR